MEWKTKAACRGKTPDLWFPQGDDATNAKQQRYDAARAICDRCPVIMECRKYAFQHDIRDGMWGGMTPRERIRTTRRP